MPEPNFIDRAIAAVAPKMAARRLRHRTEYEELSKRRYDGASRGRRTDGWIAGSTSSATEVVGQIERLRNRSRELVRNNPYASRAVASITQNVVGRGIRAQAMSPNAGLNAAIDELWREWSEKTSCDSCGLTFAGVQELAMRTVIESGEILVRRRDRRTEDGLPVPLQLELLEPDYLDDSRDQVYSQSQQRVVGGIQFDRLARVEGYWLFTEHPGDQHTFRPSYRNSRLVRADRIAHVFRVDRPGQPRGVPWAAPAMLRMRDLDDYEDAQLLRQKIAACYTAFVTDMEEHGAEEVLPDSLEPGRIEALPPSRQVIFSEPPGVQGFGEYMTHNLRAIAVTFGTTYESLVGDYSKVNFSSGRMGHLEYQRNIESWRWNMLIPRLCEPVWKWFLEQAVLAGRLPAEALEVRAKWTPPRREMVDPSKEIAATRDAVKSGLMSLSGAMREHGHDPDELLEEITEMNEKLDEHGVQFDSDVRQRSGSATEPGEEPEDDGEGVEGDESEDQESEENDQEALNQDSDTA